MKQGELELGMIERRANTRSKSEAETFFDDAQLLRKNLYPPLVVEARPDLPQLNRWWSIAKKRIGKEYEEKMEFAYKQFLKSGYAKERKFPFVMFMSDKVWPRLVPQKLATTLTNKEDLYEEG